MFVMLKDMIWQLWEVMMVQFYKVTYQECTQI